MTKKLQQKFIKIVMLTLFIVLLLLLSCINFCYNIHNYRQLNTTLEFIYDNGGNVPEDFFNKSKTPSNDIPPDNQNQNKRFYLGLLRNYDGEFPFKTRYCTIYLNTNKSITSIDSSNIMAIDNSTITTYAQELISDSKTKGWISNYYFRFFSYEDGYMLILLDGSFEKNSTIAILGISGIVFLISYCIMFVIVLLISKKAMSPLIQSYEKQKRFITDAGHELKTPLTVISADTEIAKMTFGESEWFDSIRKQTIRMQALITSMISLARMDENGEKTNFAKFCISTALYDTAMAFQGVAKNQSKELTYDIEEKLIYYGDEASIRNLLSILIDNAVKYCDDNGKIHIRLIKKGRYLIVNVSNTFANVDSVDFKQVFDRFYRGDKARTANGSYGLGLSIAQAIVQQHHGTIQARKSNPEEILFDVHLP